MHLHLGLLFQFLFNTLNAHIELHVICRTHELRSLNEEINFLTFLYAVKGLHIFYVFYLITLFKENFSNFYSFPCFISMLKVWPLITPFGRRGGEIIPHWSKKQHKIL